VIDASFKYMVFTYRAPFAGEETELYPDANMLWPTQYTIKAPKQTEVVMMGEQETHAAAGSYTINSQSPGSHAHCTQIDFEGGKANPYYESHSYQYVKPVWEEGPCDKKYDWFNSNSTIAPGVEETLFGIH